MQDPEELYLELAQKVREGLAHVDPYFEKLAKGMEDWIACWRQLNPDVRRAFPPFPLLILSPDMSTPLHTLHRSSMLWWRHSATPVLVHASGHLTPTHTLHP